MGKVTAPVVVVTPELQAMGEAGKVLAVNAAGIVLTANAVANYTEQMTNAWEDLILENDGSEDVYPGREAAFLFWHDYLIVASTVAIDS